jgi:hypothetical protein
MFLLHLMSVGSSTFEDAAFMLVLGLGLGSVMQVLVTIVQNGVQHSELGVATSGATFFRSIGGSFGTAIFGAIFSNVLVGNLASRLHGVTLPASFSSSDITPAVLKHLSAAARDGIVGGYASSIQTVFLIAVPRSPSPPAGSSRRWNCAGGRRPRPSRRRRRSHWRRSTRRASPLTPEAGIRPPVETTVRSEESRSSSRTGRGVSVSPMTVFPQQKSVRGRRCQ